MRFDANEFDRESGDSIPGPARLQAFARRLNYLTIRHAKMTRLRDCTTAIMSRIFMPEAWIPETHKSNEISSDGVFAEHGTPASFTGLAEAWRWSPDVSENRPPSAPARSANLESGPSARFRADLHPATAFAAPGTLQVNQARRRTWNVRGARFHILPGRGPPETADTYSSETAISAGVRL